jgi:hypothetical protein
LAHGTAYTWGITNASTSSSVNTLSALETAIKNGSQRISSVTLTLTGIYDWTVEPDDVLYVDILNKLSTGASSYAYNGSPNGIDSSYGIDPFSPSSGETGSLSFTALTAGNYNNALIAPKTGATYVSSAGSNPTSAAWTNPTADPGTFSAAGTTSAFTITYTLSSANVTLLGQLLGSDAVGGSTAGQDIGLGLGPDCHFYDSGIALTINTVPDNGVTLSLLGLALVALAGYAKKAKRFAQI